MCCGMADRAWRQWVGVLGVWGGACEVGYPKGTCCLPPPLIPLGCSVAVKGAAIYTAAQSRSTELSLPHLPPSLALKSVVKVYISVHFYPVPTPSILIQDTKFSEAPVGGSFLKLFKNAPKTCPPGCPLYLWSPPSWYSESQ